MLDDKKISSHELTEYFLKRIKKYNKKINAFISIDENKSMEFAKIADIDIRNKNKNILTGIPIAHKDLFCTKDFLTTCGSKMLSNFKRVPKWSFWRSKQGPKKGPKRGPCISQTLATC